MQDLHPDFNETYDLSHDIGICSALSNAHEQLIHNELKDNENRQMVRQLKNKSYSFITFCMKSKHQTIHFTHF